MNLRRTRFRRALRWGLWIIAGLVVLLALLPLWFPWVLRPTLKHAGLRYEHYQRTGCSRFSITNVTARWGNTTLRAGRVDAALPTTWLWQKYVGNTATAPEQMIIRDAVLKIGASTNKMTTTGKTDSTAEALDSLAKLAGELRSILPKGRITNSAVVVAGKRAAIPFAEWSGGKLRALVVPPGDSNAVQVALDTAPGVLSARVAAPQRKLGLDAKFVREDSAWKAGGTATWLTNHAEFSATMTTNSWWPAHAHISAPEVRLPAQMIGARGYQDLHAALAADMVSNNFDLQATGFAHPGPGARARNLPPVEFSLRARGDPDVARVEQLRISTPWLQAQLTNTIAFKTSGELLNTNAQLRVALNLDAFPGDKLRGKVGGVISAAATDRRHPAVGIRLAGQNVHAGPADIQRLALRGTYVSPVFTLNEFKARLSGGADAELSGAVDVFSREIRNLKWHLSGDNLNQFVSSVTSGRFEGSGEASGTLTNLSHSGEVVAEDLAHGKFKLAHARVNWRGEDLKLDTARIEASTGGATLLLDGMVDAREIGQRTITGAINAASLQRTNETVLALEHPFNFAFNSAETNGARIAIGQSDWSGGDRRISLAADVNWPRQGRVNLSATNLSTRDLAGIVNLGKGAFTLSSAQVSARWSNSPVQATISFAASAEDGSHGPMQADGTIEAGDMLVITNFSVTAESVPPLTIAGEIPIQIVPGRTNGWLAVNESREVNVHADWQAGGQDVSLPLGPLGAVQFSHPMLEARASGPLNDVTGTLTLNAASVDVQTSASNLLSRTHVEDLRVDGEINRGLIAVRRFEAEVDGQPIHASGELPFKSGFWQRLVRERQLPDWREARGRLQIEDAKVAALARYMPSLLAPEGRVTLDVSLSPGGNFGGEFLLTNAMTRPLGSLTPIRDIAARVKLSGSEATLESFRAEIGGEPVHATGRATIPLQGALEYHLKLQGTNIPLVRSLEILLRGDIAVELSGGGTNQTELAGKVVLHDGLFIQHATALLWSGPKRTELRPPYFSVTNPAVADWKLNLTVQGDQFLRVRMPIFNGTVSANFSINGTLREPVLIGDARVDSGRILFPFGRLTVDQGYASLSRNSPRGPDVLLNASGRNFDYDVRLEVKGPADGAQVTFSSTPPLTSEEILLMLTAGQLPRTGYTFSTMSRAGTLATYFGRDVLSRYSGSDAGESRLSITTGESISQEGKLTYTVEYKLTDRWSLVGEYDRFNAVNAEVKWKIITR